MIHEEAQKARHESKRTRISSAQACGEAPRPSRAGRRGGVRRNMLERACIQRARAAPAVELPGQPCVRRPVAGPLVVGVLWALGMKEIAGPVQALRLPFAIAIVWSLAGVGFLNRGMWPELKPGDAGLHTGLESCRREIARQRDLVRRALVWSFAPIMLAIGTFIAALAAVSTKARGLFPNGLPFLILVVAWIVAWFAIRLREQRGLQRELDELNHTD